MVQMHCIDMNAWYSRVDKPERPDFVLFDLDPPDGGFADAIRVAHLIREELERARARLLRQDERRGRDPCARPDRAPCDLRRRRTRSRSASRAGSRSGTQGSVTTEWLKRKREGVLVDHRQNAHGKTIASVYSVRPKPGAPVSTPLRWDELTEDVTPRRLRHARGARAGRTARRPVRARARRRAGPRPCPEEAALEGTPPHRREARRSGPLGVRQLSRASVSAGRRRGSVSLPSQRVRRPACRRRRGRRAGRRPRCRPACTSGRRRCCP